VQVDVPTKLSDRAKKLIQELHEELKPADAGGGEAVSGEVSASEHARVAAAK